MQNEDCMRINVCHLKEKGNDNLENTYWDSLSDCKTGVKHTYSASKF